MTLILGILATSQAAFPQGADHVFFAPAGDRPTRRDPNGVSILPNGRLITPLGQRIVVAPHPYGLCLSRDGNTLVTSSSGTGPFALTVIANPRSEATVAREIKVDATFMGLAVASDSRTLYASGGDDGTVLRYDLQTGEKTATFSLDGQIDGQGWKDSYTGDLALGADGRFLYAVDQANFRIVIIDTAAGRPVHSVPTGRYPFGLALSPDGKRAYVVNMGMFAYSPIPDGPDGKKGLPFPAFGFPSNEAREGVESDGRRIPGLGAPNVPESFSVWGIDISDPLRATVVTKIKTGWLVGQRTSAGFPAVGGSAPSAVVAGKARVFVSNANNDSVQGYNAVTGKLLWTASLAPMPETKHLRGVMPFGLALSPDETRLYVAEAGINAVGILDAQTGKVLGHLPVAWWPSKAQVSPDGKKLYVACAKGYGSGPNAGPDFKPGPEGTYVGRFLKGVLCLIDLPTDADLPQHTARVLANNGFTQDENTQSPSPPRDLDNPIPAAPGRPSDQIKYVVFITKENRTFDEVFGDLSGVNGLPELARFGQHGKVGKDAGVFVMRNHHALAKQFALSDNFYMDSDVSADGHRWLVGVYPNPWMATTYIQAYGGKNRFSLESVGRRALFGSNSSLAPEDYLEAGSIWDNFARHHLPFRNYGEGYEFAGVDEDAGLKPTGARENVNIPMPKVLFDNTCRAYPQFNTNIPDQYRVDQFLKDYKANGFEDPQKMPRFLYFHLPDDHGDAPRPKDGYPYEESYMADNDLALGRLVEFFSHTPHWGKMAIFVTEDDSQSGVDHVDAHRSLCMVISPWVKPGYISHRHTSIASILKTMNLLLGLPYLNMVDALASDLSDCFTRTPNPASYTAVAVDARVFDPAKAKDPKDPDYKQARRRPSRMMDDPHDLEREHEQRAAHSLREEKP